MEPAVIAAVISVTGAGLLGGVGFFLQRLDKKFDRLDQKIDQRLEAFEERINLKVDGLESRIEKLEGKVEALGVELRSELASLKLTVGKIEFAQDHHSEQLALIAGYSERIARLEGAVFNAES
ncbi:MAG: hypothetical protein OXF75_08905 [Acidimicrobiaceae bacterium]|nr:hypothetical protein [Acidimicrobiaceae bacterium]